MAIHIRERKRAGLERNCWVLNEVLVIRAHTYSGRHGNWPLRWLSVEVATGQQDARLIDAVY